MSRDWKIGAQVQPPESMSKIELVRVSHDGTRATVEGRIWWSADPDLVNNMLEVRVGFDGNPVGVEAETGSANWLPDGQPRDFWAMVEGVDPSARSVEVRIGQSAVTAALE